MITFGSRDASSTSTDTVTSTSVTSVETGTSTRNTGTSSRRRCGAKCSFRLERGKRGAPTTKANEDLAQPAAEENDAPQVKGWDVEPSRSDPACFTFVNVVNGERLRSKDPSWRPPAQWHKTQLSHPKDGHSYVFIHASGVKMTSNSCEWYDMAHKLNQRVPQEAESTGSGGGEEMEFGPAENSASDGDALRPRVTSTTGAAETIRARDDSMVDMIYMLDALEKEGEVGTIRDEDEDKMHEDFEEMEPGKSSVVASSILSAVARSTSGLNNLLKRKSSAESTPAHRALKRRGTTLVMPTRRLVVVEDLLKGWHVATQAQDVRSSSDDVVRTWALDVFPDGRAASESGQLAPIVSEFLTVQAQLLAEMQRVRNKLAAERIIVSAFFTFADYVTDWVAVFSTVGDRGDGGFSSVQYVGAVILIASAAKYKRVFRGSKKSRSPCPSGHSSGSNRSRKHTTAYTAPRRSPTLSQLQSASSSR